MEIVTKVMEKSWKSHGNLLVKMCTNPVIGYIEVFCNFSVVDCDLLQSYCTFERQLMRDH